MICKYVKHDNHLFINIRDKTLLLDTGSPITIGKGENFTFLSKEYRVYNEFMGNKFNEIVKNFDEEFEILLGGDILGDFYLIIDDENIIFSKQQPEFRGISIPFEKMMNIPIIGVAIDSNKLKAFWDTGAKISYVRTEYAIERTSNMIVEDFYPGYGVFTTPVYEMPIELANFNLNMEFGVLPDFLELALLSAGVEAIIGNDILYLFNVCIAYPENKIILQHK